MVLVAALVVVVTGCAGGATDPPTDITDTAATLRAHGTAGGKPTTYWFQYGPNTSYGNTTTHRDGGSGSDTKNVSERVTGLSPDTTYHFRACAQNADGSGCSPDATFRTGSPGLLPGFQETVAFSGVTQPTSVRFSPDGRVFVAEKSGLIKVFDGLGDTTPTTFADLRTKVHNYWDRGLLGLALDPHFPAKPFVYVLYTYDAAIGGTAPRWGVAGADRDDCPTPPGPTSDGCVVSGRLSRLEAIGGGNTAGPEQVLVEDWCQQFPSHSIGDLQFGADGALYVSGGEGASFDYDDYGQSGYAQEPVRRPARWRRRQRDAADRRGRLAASAGHPHERRPDRAERLDPATRSGHRRGAARQPERLGERRSRRAGSSPTGCATRSASRSGRARASRGSGTSARGPGRRSTASPSRPAGSRTSAGPATRALPKAGGYDSLDLNLCESLYSSGAVRAPFFAYRHNDRLFARGRLRRPAARPSRGWPSRRRASTWPSEFDGALFFADYSRDCIWVMERNGGALPSPSRIRPFRTGAFGVVDLQFGPDGDLYYPDLNGGPDQEDPLHRRQPGAAGRDQRDADERLDAAARGLHARPPRATPMPATRSPTTGISTATGSTTTPPARRPQFTYDTDGSYLAGVKVTDNHGASAVDAVAISAGNTPPTATILTPSTGLTWQVGDTINFSGSAVDDQDGALGPGRPQLDDHAAALPLELPPARGHERRRRGERIVRHARPRVPVLPRAPADGDRQRRADRHADGAARSRRPCCSRSPRRPPASR